MIAIGDIQTNVKLNRVERVSKGVYNSIHKNIKSSSISRQISEKTINFNSTLDVRGLRGEACLKEVEDLIDNAIILGFPEVKIIHGRGDGILRTIIRERLKNIKQVQSLSNEHADRGGDGATIVIMK